MDQEPPKKMGRPKKIVDHGLFDEVIELPLSQADIAKILRCDIDTVNRYCRERFGKSFAVVQDENRQHLKRKLLAKQIDVALKGSIPMLIFLGKNLLGQSDKTEIQGNESKPISLQYTPNAIKEAISVRPETIAIESKEVKDDNGDPE